MRKTRRKFLTHDVAMGATILALANWQRTVGSKNAGGC